MPQSSDLCVWSTFISVSVQDITFMFNMFWYLLCLCALLWEWRSHRLLRLLMRQNSCKIQARWRKCYSDLGSMQMEDYKNDCRHMGLLFLSQSGECHMFKLTEGKQERRHEQPCEVHCTHYMSVSYDINHKCEVPDWERLSEMQNMNQHLSYRAWRAFDRQQ